MKPSVNRRPSRPAHRPNHGGFTLVELLVTITIVATLAATAVVIFGKMKQKAYQTRAVTSLRGVGAASLAYSAENLGDINTLRWVGDPKEGKPWVSNSYWGRLQPYLFEDIGTSSQQELKTEIGLRLDAMFHSSDADTMEKTFLSGAKIYHDGSGLPVPVGFNRNLYEWGEFLKQTRFGDASRVIYAAYGFGLFDASDGRVFVPRPTDGSKPDNNIYYTDEGKAMVAYLDGRVELLRPGIPERRFE